jgi:nucleoside-diphosphate-sugar epimerase/predicted dehydrogenase
VDAGFQYFLNMSIEDSRSKNAAMSDSKKIRSAIVGCGRISAIHIAALKALRDVEIVAVCDLDEKLAHSQASQNDIPASFTDMETMMNDVRPDVVHLLTPPRTHLALTKIAAKYGAHLYAEKPLASSESDARAIFDVVQQSGIRLCAGHSLLFEPAFREAARRIRAGEIGRIISVRAEQGFTYEAAARSATIPWSYTYDWGIFDNIMPHPLYLANFFLKEPGPLKVVGFSLGRVREAGVEEIRALIPAEDAVGEVALSLCNAPEVSRVEVVGTNGRILVDFVTKTMLCSGTSGLPGFVTRLTANFNTALKLTTGSAGVIFGLGTGKIKRYMGIRTLVAEFYRSLLEGSEPPVPVKDGVLTVQQMEQIKNACADVMKQRIRAEITRPVQDEVRPRVLVTGATGFVGRNLVKRLSADGVTIRATARLISRAEAMPGVHWLPCDLTREDDVKRALSGIETVFHCAGMVGPPGSLADYERANVKATLSLAQLAAPAGVKTFIYVSSVSVYGSVPESKYLDESAPYDPRAKDRGVYTQTKLEADKALLEFVSRQNGHRTPRIIILRPGTIYGPGAALPLGRFPLPSPHRFPIITGSRRVPVPLTYIDNMIDAMLSAVQSEAPTGSIYNVVDSAKLDQGRLCRTLRKISNGRIRPVFLPYPFVWGMMLGIDAISLVRQGKLGTARFRLRRTLADMRFNCTAARKCLGWQPRISLTEGLTRVISKSTERPLSD